MVTCGMDRLWGGQDKDNDQEEEEKDPGGKRKTEVNCLSTSTAAVVQPPAEVQPLNIHVLYIFSSKKEI